MNRYRQDKKTSIFPYLAVAFIAFMLGWQFTSYGFISNVTETEKTVVKNHQDTDLSLFWTVWDEIEKSYVDLDKVHQDTMIYGAIKGMVNSLDDPYSVFMNPEESKEFSSSLEGKLEGIGAELSVEEGNLTIVTPLRDSPAEAAGLLTGDIIYKVDGDLTYEMSLFDAIMHIRGEKGTTVVLTIIREDVKDPFEVSIVRDSIDIESVSSEELDNNIVYISVNQFNEKTIDEFNKIASELILKEPKGIIIDLRYNGGGYLDVSVDLLSYLLPPNSEVVKIKQRNATDEIIYSKGVAKLSNIPLVVLVNEGSASASEIVAGAVQAHKRGVIMGVQTFGKGTVQEVEPFKDGSSMRLTIAKWFTPDDINITETGLTPDIIVEITDEDYENEFDRQKDEAIKYLNNL